MQTTYKQTQTSLTKNHIHIKKDKILFLILSTRCVNYLVSNLHTEKNPHTSTMD